MLSLLAAVLVASLLGSGHCAAMCGGFVAFGAGSGASQVAYHGGRLVTYVLLGVAAGAAGAALDLGGRLAGLPDLAAIVSGALMIAWGTTALARGGSLPFRSSPRVGRWLVRIHTHLATQRPAVRGLLLGLATTLLPCGWLYAFAATAAGTGGPLAGAGAMAVFWLGTVPALAALAFGLRRAAGKLRLAVPRLGAALVVAAGLATIAIRIAPSFGPAPMEHCHDR
jgi:uncharacterized protein